MTNKIFICCKDEYLSENIKEKINYRFKDKLCGFEVLPVLKADKIDGYDIKIFPNEIIPLASVRFLGKLSFNKYSLNTSALEKAVLSFPRDGKISFLKGLGPMLLKFNPLKERLFSVLTSDTPMIVLSSSVAETKKMAYGLDDAMIIEAEGENSVSALRELTEKIKEFERRII